METLQKTSDPDQTGSGLENKEKLNELEAIPIFRNNDLYSELFPEIKAAFEKGEEPTIKKLVGEILKYPNKQLIFDNTCRNKFMYANVTSEDLPQDLDWQKILEGSANNSISTNTFKKIIEEKYNIRISPNDFIENKINEVLMEDFSPKLVDELFEIANQKNPNIKQVYILSDAITDHVYEDKSNFPKEKVLPTLVEEARKFFGVEPIVLPIINESLIKEGDLIIVDRHNPSLKGDIVKQKPTQFSVLPMETELSNNDRYLGGNHLKVSGGLTEKLRNIFEKKIEAKDSEK